MLHSVHSDNNIRLSHGNRKSICFLDSHAMCFTGFHQKGTGQPAFIRGFHKKTHFFTVFFINISGLLRQIFH